ncbi:MAG: hypothetical protein ACI86M_001079 [Saprospiraceae bacterium]|jgi:hypothetical protein
MIIFFIVYLMYVLIYNNLILIPKPSDDQIGHLLNIVVV